MEKPNEINESTAGNHQYLPSQAKQKTTTAAVFRDYLKEVKDLSHLVEKEDTLSEALGYLTNRLLQGVATKESDISLEPTKNRILKERQEYWAAWRGSSII